MITAAFPLTRVLRSSLNNLAHLYYRPPKRRIVFIHIPRCGGTSVEQAVAELYPPYRRFFLLADKSVNAALHYFNVAEDELELPGALYRYREAIFHYIAQSNYDFISGHFNFHAKLYDQYRSKHSFTLLLRDPVERWISHYFYNRYKTSNHFRNFDRIDAVIDSPSGKRMGNGLTKAITDPDDDAYHSLEHRVEAAKKNLHLFDVVGFLDDLDRFTLDFFNAYKRKLVIPKKNENPKTIAEINKEITPAHHDRIRELCKTDSELYQYAKTQLVK